MLRAEWLSDPRDDRNHTPRSQRSADYGKCTPPIKPVAHDRRVRHCRQAFVFFTNEIKASQLKTDFTVNKKRLQCCRKIPASLLKKQASLLLENTLSGTAENITTEKRCNC
ncbi:hypothetical protein BaRGS_00037967 [Batillaria attramentaria]|uniref:Uncharacterized protein n=1 Tax=Batillaria attramentaria TaxID=370345 RepID=A0ABD0J7A4_9CAEN